MKVIKQDGSAIYETTLAKMPEAWYLTNHEFIFMEDLTNEKLTHVHLKNGEKLSTKDIYLPEGTIIKPPINANLEQFVEAFDCEDKQALRDQITRLNNSDIREPEMMRITCQRNKVYYLAEPNTVAWFKPDDFESGHRLTS